MLLQKLKIQIDNHMTLREKIVETVRNTSVYDRPSAWTQHVTLGPPFLEKGATAFRSTATKSKVIENRKLFCKILDEPMTTDNREDFD